LLSPNINFSKVEECVVKSLSTYCILLNSPLILIKLYRYVDIYYLKPLQYLVGAVVGSFLGNILPWPRVSLLLLGGRASCRALAELHVELNAEIKEESYNLVNFFVSSSGLTYDNTWDGHSQYTDPTPQSAPFLENFWLWGMDPWIAGRPSCPLNPCHPRHSIPLPPQHLPPLPSAKRDSQPGEHLPGQGSGGKLSSPTSESMPLGLKSESESESESEFETTIYEKILLCTLEELFNGTTRKLKIKTRAYDQAVEKTFLVEKILNVFVR
jgi:hypothetical protein